MGNVLVPFDWSRGYQALAALSRCPAEEVRRRIKESGLFDTMERGRIEPREAARRLGELLEFEIPFEQFRAAWSSIFDPQPILTEDFLRSLRRKCPLLLVSNTDAIHYEWIEQHYGLLRHFDERILSFEAGARKPEPEIYQQAIARAGCRPEEVFFADDRPENVEGALAAGMDAVRFESPAQLEGELRRRGADW